MKPLDDWMILEKEEKKSEAGLVLPDSVRNSGAIDVGDIFVASVLGPDVKERIKIGDRCLFYGLGAVAHMKLPSGKMVYTGRAEDVKWVLEEGE